MKSMLLSLTIAASMAFTACGGRKAETTNTPQQQTVIAQSVDNKPGAHLCGAPTKAGKPCTRRVSDVHGKDARCWQHQQ